MKKILFTEDPIEIQGKLVSIIDIHDQYSNSEVEMTIIKVECFKLILRCPSSFFCG